MKDRNSLSSEIKGLLSSCFLPDFEPFLTITERIISKISNWKFLSEKEISDVCEAFGNLCESKMQSILIESRFLEKISCLIDSETVPLKIQNVLVQ